LFKSHVSLTIKSKFILVELVQCIALLHIYDTLDLAFTMGLPVAHADPAELMFTHSAGHMVTTFILFDVHFAVWTFF